MLIGISNIVNKMQLLWQKDKLMVIVNLVVSVTTKNEVNKMQILVDADACPVKEIIIKIAKRYKIPVTMLIDTAHELNDGYSTVITVDQERDSVDFALMKQLTKEDIVVTQDFGLAALVLGKGAKAVNQNGLIYTNDNIDKLLFERFLGQKVRRGGGRTTHPKKRTKEDNERFEKALLSLIPGLIFQTFR